MAIRYDDNLNKRLLSSVKNFNAKVRYNKYKTRGKGMLPQTLSLKELKAKYSDKSRAELEKQLKLYQSFGSRESLQKATENSRISKWELNFFRTNYEKTFDFYNKEIADLSRIIGDKPEYYLQQHNRLQTLEDKRAFLQKDFESLTEDEIKIMRSVFSYAERSELVKKQGFKLYLEQLDRLLTLRQIPKAKREAFINKFNVLSENEFTELVRNEDLINRIYHLVNSPEGRGKYELTTDDADADAVIRELWSTSDELIAKYKQNG